MPAEDGASDDGDSGDRPEQERRDDQAGASEDRADDQQPGDDGPTDEREPSEDDRQGARTPEEDDRQDRRADAGRPGRRQGRRDPRRQRRRDRRASAPPVETGEVGYVVAVFGLIGAGIGLNGLLGPLLAGGPAEAAIGALLATTGLAVAISGGPIVAVLSSLGVAERVDADDETVLLTAGVASGVGHLVMMVVAVLVLSLGIGGGDGGGGGGGGPGAGAGGAGDLLSSVGDLVLPMLLIAVGTAVVGVGAAFLRVWLRDR